MTRWSLGAVEKLAPDASSLAAARRLATPGPWSDTGSTDTLVWGKCQGSAKQPDETVFVLISDLFEGGIAEEMLQRARAIVDSGAVMIALLALSDSGAPAYDREHAAALTALGVPAFACTPDLFPDLMAAAIQRDDIGRWAAGHDILVTGVETEEA